jgi:SAM-dependent methyltransferase
VAKEKHFDSIATTYNAQAAKGLWGWFKAKEKTAVLQALQSSGKTPKILDLGCGTGIHAEFITKQIPESRITGLDRSFAMIQEFKSNGYVGYQVDIETEPFPDGTFDVILLLGVLEFMKDLSLLVKSIKKASAPGAKVVLLLPTRSPLNFFYWLYHRVRKSDVLLRSKKEYLDLFKQNGFELEQEQKVTWISRLLVLRMADGIKSL